MHAAPLVSLSEAREFLQALVANGSAESEGADFRRLHDRLIIQLYRETIERRGMGRIIHKHQHVFGNAPCIIAQNCLKPRHAVILLHGFASSPLHAFSFVERYHNIALSAEQVAWIIPQGPIMVSSLECECVYTKVANKAYVPDLLSDGNLYCWWELNSSLKTRGALRQLVKIVKNKLFSPINVNEVLRSIQNIIGAVSDAYALPNQQIYIAGFCQGATLAAEYLIMCNSSMTKFNRKTFSQKFASSTDLGSNSNASMVVPDSPLGGGILLCGGPCRTRQTRMMRSSKTGVISDKNALLCSPNIPLFLAHGLKDTVVPYTLGRLLRRRLINRGFDNIEFCPFKGGHEIPDDVIQKIKVWFTTYKEMNTKAKSDSRFQKYLHPVKHRRAASITGIEPATPIMEPPAARSMVIQPLQNAQVNWAELPTREAQIIGELWLRIPRSQKCIVVPDICAELYGAPDESTLFRHVSGYSSLGQLRKECLLLVEQEAANEAKEGGRRKRLTRRLFGHPGENKETSHVDLFTTDDESSFEGTESQIKYWLM